MKLSDVLGCVGGTALLLLASIWVPFVGPLISLLTPLIFLYYSTKLGLFDGIKLAVLTTLVLGLFAKFTGQPQVIIFCLEFSFMGLVLSELFRKGLTLGKTMLATVIIMSMTGLFFLFMLSLSKGSGPFEMLLNYMEIQLKSRVAIYEGMGAPSQEAAAIEAYLKAFMAIVARIYPSLMILGTAFAVWLNVILAKALFVRTGLEYPDFGPVDHWQAPEEMVWGIIVSGFALFLSSGGIQFFAINAFIVMIAVYFFHGLSISLFFLNKFHVPRLIRAGFYVLIMVQQLCMILLVLAGIFDQWIDFRKIHRRMDR